MPPLYDDCAKQYKAAPAADALKTCEKALEVARQQNNPSAIIAGLMITGAIYSDLNNHPETLKRLTEALEATRILKDKGAEALLLGTLGETYVKLDDRKKGQEYFQEALALALAIGDSATEASIKRDMDIALDDSGKKGKALQETKLGVESYKNAKYEDAVQHFQRAVQLDESLVNAHLYLATTYAQIYFPEVDAPENTQTANRAKEEYKWVLALEPRNLTAIKGLAFFAYNQKDFALAKEFHKQAMLIDPTDTESYYSAAVMDWAEAYQIRMASRVKLGIKSGEMIADIQVCKDIRAQNGARVEEGIKLLEKALELRPDYDDAMAYMNLMYRERADYECEDQQARREDLRLADEWVDRTLMTKKAREDSKKSAN